VTGLPEGATATLNASQWTALSATSWQVPANTTLGNVSLHFQHTRTNSVVPSAAANRPEDAAACLGRTAVALCTPHAPHGRKLALVLLLLVSAAAITA